MVIYSVGLGPVGNFSKFITTQYFYQILKKSFWIKNTTKFPFMNIDLLRNIHRDRGPTSWPTSKSLKDEIKTEYIPRRALLYVPGNDVKKLDKIPNIEADCVIMDCEDGVAVSQKHNARETIHKYVQRKDELFKGKDCSVRVNGIDTDLFRADMQAVLKGPVQATTLVLPKVESPDHISKFSDTLNELCENYRVNQNFRLIIYVESAKALLGLQAICEKTLEKSKSSPFALDGIVFGSDDFCADVGATRTSSSREVFFARQWTVTVAKAFNLQAIDVVYIDYKDLDGLKEQCLEGAGFGFTGKQVIHPSQVQMVQEAFSPTEKKIKWATDLIKAFTEHENEGKGAFTFEDIMVDRPLVKQAQNILRMASATSKANS